MASWVGFVSFRRPIPLWLQHAVKNHPPLTSAIMFGCFARFAVPHVQGGVQEICWAVLLAVHRRQRQRAGVDGGQL
jgi:hypothetical protein